ncbi:MAG: YkgJ family cysteine cluster protein [Spirochaetia bacterium]|nr:YkgJ family cysteine cluster protein [Spirochaetia bacterium]
MQPALWNSTLMRRFSALDRIYGRIESSQQDFKRASDRAGNPIACPIRCGSCCVHFTPDVTPLEAERLAYYLLVERKDLIDHFFSQLNKSAKAGEAWTGDSACPFWNPERPGENCMVYPARALVCRLFGYCAVLDKEGRPSFALCDKMPSLAGRQERIFSGEAMLQGLFGRRPPLMDEFSREVLALDPSGAGQRRSVIEALPTALEKIALLLQLAEADADQSDAALSPSEADSDPDDFPIAS